MNAAVKQPSFVLDESHKQWIRDNWPDLASHFDLFQLEYVRLEKASKSYEALEDGKPTGRYRRLENVNPVNKLDVAPAICQCCGQLAPVKTPAAKLDKEIQEQMPTDQTLLGPRFLWAAFAVVVLMAVLQWWAS